MAYKSNVFVNCPFDEDYYPLLKPLLFTILYCGYKPCLSETSDGGSIRIEEIQQLIEGSKYSVHDLSRMTSDPPRFNMPYELGLDIGCRVYSKSDKVCLILEEKKHRYKEVISDIAGQDISHHENSPILITKCVRDWMYKIKSRSKPVAYTIIWDLYNEFVFDFSKEKRTDRIDPNKIWEIPFSELIDNMAGWIKSKKNPKS